MRRTPFFAASAFLAVGLSQPAQAEVTHVGDTGFAVLHVTQIAATPDKVWAALIAPQKYWSSAHSWSGDAANMYLDPQAGGCFCERLPTKSATGSSLNSVEHMRVIYSESPRVLRMSGALGPLQSEAVVGTMNIAMEAYEGGTKISLSYVVGGYMRMKAADIAPAVDAVTGEQLLRLKAVAEGRDPKLVVWQPKKAVAKDDAAAIAKPVAPAGEGEKPAIPSPKPATLVPAEPKPKDAPKVAPNAAGAAPAVKPATKATTPVPVMPKPVEKPPLSDRLKATDETTANVPASPEKKKPIIEDAPNKAKLPPPPPGNR